jgi:c-di-GMP-binding flagellar brake protein YcgR
MRQAIHLAHAQPSPRMLDSDLQDTDNTVTYHTPLAIARILEEACAKRAPLTIKFETASRIHRFHARIQSVDPLRMEMVLHRLMPPNWIELVMQGLEVDVSCLLPSGVLRFQSQLSPLEADTTNPYCVLTLPQVMQKHQMRSSYRVVVPPGTSALSFTWEAREVRGFCFNLSLEGCCGIFRAGLDGLTRDIIVPDFNISLDDSLQFTTGATVCRRQVMHNGSTLLGLRFEALDSDLQRRLQASLTSIQRRQLRTRS